MVRAVKKSPRSISTGAKQRVFVKKRGTLNKDEHEVICTLKPGDYMEAEMGYEMMDGENACNEYEKEEENS